MTIYSTETLFKTMSLENLQYTLQSFLNEDYTLKDFNSNKKQKEFLYILELYELVYISSNGRVLLTPKGEKTLQQLNCMLI